MYSTQRLFAYLNLKKTYNNLKPLLGCTSVEIDKTEMFSKSGYKMTFPFLNHWLFAYFSEALKLPVLSPSEAYFVLSIFPCGDKINLSV